MRFTSSADDARNKRVALNLASMIDVTFLLLIYFLVTMVLAPQEDRLDPLLQTQSDSGAGPAPDLLPQRVEVGVFAGTPGYRLGERITSDRRELAELLQALPKTTDILIDVSDQVSVGFAVTALQVAHDAGFERVTYVPAR